MSELVKICRFKGKDNKLKFCNRYIVEIKEAEEMVTKKDLLCTSSSGQRTFTYRTVTEYYIIAKAQGKTFVYSDFENFLKDWEIVG